MAMLTLLAVILLSLCLRPPGDGDEKEAPIEARLIYPQGDLFPVMLYSVAEDHLASVKDQGFNLVHTYGYAESWLKSVGENGLFALVPLGTYDQRDLWNESFAQSYIDAHEGYESLAWWNLPEEMTWTVDWKLNQVKDLAAWIRRYDGRNRPTYEYLAGNYIAYDIRNYVPYVDIIGIGAYVDYNEQPRQWIRWAVKQVTAGIEEAGYKVGNDYLGNERVPVAVLQMFIEGGTHIQNGQESYHDVWSAVCAGAKGILIFSHHYRTQFPPEVYQAFCKAAVQLTGKHDLGRVVLFGEDLGGISAKVTKGPATTPPFDSWGGKNIVLPTINMMAKQHEGTRYIFAVNDVDEPVTVRFGGLPSGITEVTVIDEGRTIEIAEGGFADDFDDWGVHLYLLK